MSGEQTAEYFKDKSEEEIINWMLANLSTAQIKECLGSETPTKLEKIETRKLTEKDLRSFCSGKKYVIHKIQGESVLFWYYIVKSDKWVYSKEPLENFPQTIDQVDSEECGKDTEISSDDVKKSYNDNVLSGEKLFSDNNDGLDMNNVFNTVKNEYKNDNINPSWLYPLLVAINIQKNCEVQNGYKELFNFCPVLIESISKDKVSYYYLVNKNGELSFVEANLSINGFADDISEVMDDLKLTIIKDGEAGPSDSDTISGFQNKIRDAANKIDSSDLKRIKDIYNKFPLSETSSFFMNNIFSQTEFGKLSKLSKLSTLSNSEMKEKVKQQYGSNLLKDYTPEIITNKFGVSTIILKKK